jgi:hypothetical protein
MHIIISKAQLPIFTLIFFTAHVQSYQEAIGKIKQVIKKVTKKHCQSEAIIANLVSFFCHKVFNMIFQSSEGHRKRFYLSQLQLALILQLYSHETHTHRHHSAHHRNTN